MKEIKRERERDQIIKVSASTKPIREINEDNGSNTARPTPANERQKTRPVETG